MILVLRSLILEVGFTGWNAYSWEKRMPFCVWHSCPWHCNLQGRKDAFYEEVCGHKWISPQKPVRKKRQIVRSLRKYTKVLLGAHGSHYEFLTWSIFLFFLYYLILPLCSKVSLDKWRLPGAMGWIVSPLTTWPASWETCMQVRKQQLELDMEQQTGSK